MAAVFGRYGTGPLSLGAALWIPGVKMEITAKKWRKNGQKWARYGLRKRVRAADLFVMDRYFLISTVIFTYLYPAKGVLPSQKLRHYKLYKQRCEALLVKRRAWYKEYQVRVCKPPLALGRNGFAG